MKADDLLVGVERHDQLAALAKYRLPDEWMANFFFFFFAAELVPLVLLHTCLRSRRASTELR